MIRTTLLVALLSAAVCVYAQDDCPVPEASVDASFNSEFLWSMEIGRFTSYASYYDGDHMLVIFEPTEGKEYYYNVNNPFDPILVKTISGYSQCAGGVVVSDHKIGDYVAHFGTNAVGTPSCDCVEGEPCIAFLRSTTNAQPSVDMEVCDNTGFAIATRDVDSSAALANPLNGCDTLSNSLIGQTAIIIRGGCSFQNKLDNAIAAGATSVVIVNSAASAGQPCSGMQVTINDNTPFVMISYNDGAPIISALENAGTVNIKMGTTYRDDLISSQPSRFGGLWGTSQGTRLVPFNAKDLSSSKYFYSDGADKSFYQPDTVVGFLRQPENVKTDRFLLIDYDYNVKTARFNNGELEFIGDTWTGFDSISNSVMFQRDSGIYAAVPNFFEDDAYVIDITNAHIDGSGTKLGGVNLLEPQVITPFPPDFRYISFGSGSTLCTTVDNKLWHIYDFQNLNSPSTTSNLFTNNIRSPGGGMDQANRIEFQQHQRTRLFDGEEDGAIIGCAALSSEGVFLFSVDQPTKPFPVSSYDSTKRSAEYTLGARNCLAGTRPDYTFYFANEEDGLYTLFAIRPFLTASAGVLTPAFVVALSALIISLW